LKLRKEHHPQALTARVAARDPNLWNLQMVLDRGSLDGVHRDMVVVAPQGLVGRVFQVGPKACRVRLLLDPRSAIPAVLADSGALGIVYGHDAQTCTMKFIAHDVPIREGELVMTSGLGEVYPRGIPLGRVIRRLGRTEALFQSVQVRSEVEFRALREALLLSRNRGD
jgi:rod shape-determining protein MreC